MAYKLNYLHHLILSLVVLAAPLSGPMVVAEALGKRRKISTKPSKLKEQENKEKYLFKRRDESSEGKIQQKGQGILSRQPPSAAFSVGEQKRADGSLVEPPSMSAETSSRRQAPKSSFDNGKGALSESKGVDRTMNLKHDRQRATTSGLDEGFHQLPSLPDADRKENMFHRRLIRSFMVRIQERILTLGKRRPSFLNVPLGNWVLRNLPRGKRI